MTKMRRTYHVGMDYIQKFRYVVLQTVREQVFRKESASRIIRSARMDRAVEEDLPAVHVVRSRVAMTLKREK